MHQDYLNDCTLARSFDTKVFLYKFETDFLYKHNRHADQSDTIRIFVKRTCLTL